MNNEEKIIQLLEKILEQTKPPQPDKWEWVKDLPIKWNPEQQEED
jgi:hypothetical protein